MVFHCPWLSACDAALSSSQAKAFIRTTAGFPKREATAANFLKLRASKSQSILANLSYWTSWVTGPDWMWEVENRGVHRKGWISTGRILVLSTTYLQSHLAHVVRTGYVSGPSKLQPRNSYRIHIVDGCSVIKGKEIQMYDVPCMKPAHTRQSVSCRFTCLRCIERTTLRRSRGDCVTHARRGCDANWKQAWEMLLRWWKCSKIRLCRDGYTFQCVYQKLLNCTLRSRESDGM